MDKQTLVKNARRLRIGRCFAYIDILIFSAFYFDGTHYIISPFVDGYSTATDLQSVGYATSYVTLFVDWASYVLIIFTTLGYVSDEVILDKNKLRKRSFILFLISILLLTLTLLISPFLENSILWKLDVKHTTQLMGRLYRHYSLFILYTFIRWVGNFDYYKYYHYEKGQTYNHIFFYYLFIGMLILSFIYGLFLEILQKYAF